MSHNHLLVNKNAMRFIEKFSIATAIIGLAADLITIAGFSSGVFILSDDMPGVISKSIIEKLSFVILLYCNAVILVWVFNIYRRTLLM